MIENSDSFPNNDFCFTEDDFIESINNINDATRHRDNYNFTWNKIRDLEGVEYISNIDHKNGPITWKVVPGCDEGVFEDQHKEEMKKIDDLFSPILDEEGECNLNNDYSTIFFKSWPKEIETELEKLNSAIVDANA